MTEKKKYIVTVTKLSGGWNGQETKESKDIITYATSKAKAEKQSEGQYSFDDYDDNVYQEPES